jgi:hypothetical protein
LVWLGLFALGLQIDNLSNTIPGKNVMITPYPFLESEATKQLTLFSKLDV